MHQKIQVSSLVTDVACPAHCEACERKQDERRARREAIMAAQARAFDEPWGAPLTSAMLVANLAEL